MNNRNKGRNKAPITQGIQNSEIIGSHSWTVKYTVFMMPDDTMRLMLIPIVSISVKRLPSG
ncbi:hypothetical protein FA047_01685 [Pedobacter frigoris]|uniref:Uncharacterized protein n=1 Tax=Pedobacter frigoris TaxID=2571272 RepID=A0A4U1CN21_9SPHI|nr:hypothetical protein [Pedobacter frigoris]TKC08833.1 hypothetical protein FA047_01685 [Pedobacter frigoris]